LGTTTNMKSLKIIFFHLSLPIAYNFQFNSDSEDSGCELFQDCRAASQCPSVVKNFKERNIQPKICSFGPRSVLVCCNRTEEVETTPSRSGGGQCGVSASRTIFNFNLGSRQADPGSSVVLRAPPTVVGGEAVQVNTYPWMAALGSKTADGSVTWFCGGSYIGDNLILTAAHCIPTAGSGLSLDVVRLGAPHDLTVPEASTEDFQVSRLVLHPGYSAAQQQGRPGTHDIALLELLAPDLAHAQIRPVCLPSPELQLEPGARLVVAGWGAAPEGGLTAARLQGDIARLGSHWSRSSRTVL